MKKIILLATVMLSLCVAYAQNAVGDWRIHTPFVGSNVTNVVEGHRWVYYLSGVLPLGCEPVQTGQTDPGE